MTLLILALINFTIIFLALPFPVSAALGGDTASIKADLSRMKGAINIIQAGAYSIHEITLSTGTVVREYVSSTGIVFGVAWQGQFMPNLEQILGAYFNQYSAASKTEHVKHLGRRPLNIQRSGLVVQTGGHMRAYVGRVYIPSRIPQGVTAEIIR